MLKSGGGNILEVFVESGGVEGWSGRLILSHGSLRTPTNRNRTLVVSRPFFFFVCPILRPPIRPVRSLLPFPMLTLFVPSYVVQSRHIFHVFQSCSISETTPDPCPCLESFPVLFPSKPVCPTVLLRAEHPVSSPLGTVS